jgi:uncharacterized protein YifE (UPF0438 family)
LKRFELAHKFGSLEGFELAYDDMIIIEFDQCKYFELTKRSPDVYYELLRCLNVWGRNMKISDMDSFAILTFCYYAHKHNIQGYLYSLFCQWNKESVERYWDLSKFNGEFDASRFEASVEFMMKEQSMRVRHDKEVLALRSKEKETCSKYKETVAYVQVLVDERYALRSKEKETRSKYKETVAYMQAKGVENQLLVNERTALHTQLLNSGASHKRFKTNVSAYISKKNGLIRDLQTRFSELESKNKELTEQLLECTAAKSVSDTQLEECKAEKEDLTEQLAHTQSLLLQSITSIGKRKRSVFDASQ